MFEWIADHNQILNTAFNGGMLVVWIAYLQVFLSGYRRQRRASILITRSAGADLDSRCVVTNMSAETIYVASIIASVSHDDVKVSLPVTDAPMERGAQQSAVARDTRQGALASGSSRDIGSFRAVLEHVLESAGERMLESAAYEIEILLLADYASEALLVGARRCFVLSPRDGNWHVRPDSLRTDQVRSRRERKAIQRRLEDEL